MITFSKIEDENPLSLCCPYCSTPRLQLSANDACVPGGGYWLTDGDTIFGLWDMLVKAGKIAADTADLANFDYDLLVGDCPSCGNAYFVVYALFIDAEVDDDWVHVYFHCNGDRGTPTNFRASLPVGRVQEWATEQFETEKGVMQHHTFGPFKMDEDIRGPYGVCACQGADSDYWDFAKQLLFDLWDELRLAAEIANKPLLTP